MQETDAANTCCMLATVMSDHWTGNNRDVPRLFNRRLHLRGLPGDWVLRYL